MNYAFLIAYPSTCILKEQIEYQYTIVVHHSIPLVIL